MYRERASTFSHHIVTLCDSIYLYHLFDDYNVKNDLMEAEVAFGKYNGGGLGGTSIRPAKNEKLIQNQI